MKSPALILSAQRATKPHAFPRPSKLIQREGLSYQRKVYLALKRNFNVEYGPWFKYEKWGLPRYCQPDIILHESSRAIVIEIKLAATPLALEKLESLYVPVVSSALGVPAKPLVITRSLSHWSPAGTPRGLSLDRGLSFTASLTQTIDSLLPLYLWSGRGQIR